MPKYDYLCKSCHAGFEIERGMSEPEGELCCPHCASATVRRVFARIALGGIERVERAEGPSADAQAVLQGGCAGCSHHHH